MKVTFEIPYSDGDSVLVKNYRRGGKWEEGSVQQIAAIIANGDVRMKYTCWMPAKYRPGRPTKRMGYLVTVGADGIRKIS